MTILDELSYIEIKNKVILEIRNVPCPIRGQEKVESAKRSETQSSLLTIMTD